MRILCVALMACLFLLNGCAEFGLQSRKESTTTEMISTSSYKVSFCGNAYMSQQEAEKYAMQRACELTLKKGFTHFAVLDKSDRSEVCMLSDVSRTASYTSTENVPNSFAGPRNIIRPNMALKVQCYKKEQAPKDAIDAQKYLDENFPGLKFK